MLSPVSLTCLLSPVQLDETTKVKTAEAEMAFKPKTLLSYMKRFPIKRVVHLPNVTADPIKFDLVYNVSEGSDLPPGAASPLMAQFVLTGVDSTLAKYNTTGKSNNGGQQHASTPMSYIASGQ